MTKTMNKAERLTAKRMGDLIDGMYDYRDINYGNKLPEIIIISNAIAKRKHRKLVAFGWEYVGEYLPGWREYRKMPKHIRHETKKP